MKAQAPKYAPLALSDLAAIRSYLRREAGGGASARMIARLRLAIAAAREQPSAGTPRAEYGANCRFVVQRPYIIYYDFDGATMIVLRVLHWAQDRDAPISEF